MQQNIINSIYGFKKIYKFNSINIKKHVRNIKKNTFSSPPPHKQEDIFLFSFHI